MIFGTRLSNRLNGNASVYQKRIISFEKTSQPRSWTSQRLLRATNNGSEKLDLAKKLRKILIFQQYVLYIRQVNYLQNQPCYHFEFTSCQKMHSPLLRYVITKVIHHRDRNWSGRPASVTGFVMFTGQVRLIFLDRQVGPIKNWSKYLFFRFSVYGKLS